MGRKKLEMKRIEDKSSRLVTFSKRRVGLIKKARHLSVLCDVDVAVIVFSARGKLYESCTGSTSRMEHILSRYQKSCLEEEVKEEEKTFQGAGEDLCKRFQTCKELLQTVDRLVEEKNNNNHELPLIEITQLEEDLDAALEQTRSRKTQLMVEYISTLQEQEKKLGEDKEQLEKLIAASEEKQIKEEGLKV
ncbi:unnamed protein product [Lactuca saligna]|uniref:MADS-box domain-containing protein n=1 Tax=Lactuca saligna TaxID=75948 RepID=A0AA35YQA6_LACSI|nr:unnamed protein product [Lactuca saligna]